MIALARADIPDVGARCWIARTRPPAWRSSTFWTGTRAGATAFDRATVQRSSPRTPHGGDRGVAQRVDEVGPPVPLVARRIERVERALPHRQRQRHGNVQPVLSGRVPMASYMTRAGGVAHVEPVDVAPWAPASLRPGARSDLTSAAHQTLRPASASVGSPAVGAANQSSTGTAQHLMSVLLDVQSAGLVQASLPYP